MYQPDQQPAFFDLLVEKRHVDNLAADNLDEESRLQVIYRILKDHLRNAKKELIQVKKDREKRAQQALEFKKMLEQAKERKDKENISGKIREVINEEGSGAFEYLGSQRHLSS